MRIDKRTFKALEYPKDSNERIELNKNPLTSEYMISNKFILIYDIKKQNNTNIKIELGFKTKKDALRYFETEKQIITTKDKNYICVE